MTPQEREAKWWAYYARHHRNIRTVVAMYAGPFPLMQLTAAVQEKNIEEAMSVLNTTWIRAPDKRDVYLVPGFQELCNLLDGTATGE